MATYGKKLLDSEGNIILPKTRSSLVYMDDNETVEDKIKKILSEITKIKNGSTVVALTNNSKVFKSSDANTYWNARFVTGDEGVSCRVYNVDTKKDMNVVGIDQTARNTANAAMPKSGGRFTGKVVMQWSGSGADTSGLQVMNNLCQTSAGANVSSKGFIFRRK